MFKSIETLLFLVMVSLFKETVYVWNYAPSNDNFWGILTTHFDYTLLGFPDI